MKKFTITRTTSLISGVVAALGLGYQQLAEVWKLPLGSEVNQTAGIAVMVISLCLSAITGKKIAENSAYKAGSFEALEAGVSVVPPAEALAGDGPSLEQSEQSPASLSLQNEKIIIGEN